MVSPTCSTSTGAKPNKSFSDSGGSIISKREGGRKGRKREKKRIKRKREKRKKERKERKEKISTDTQARLYCGISLVTLVEVEG